MKKQNIYVYPLDGKVIFPYHEYRFTISSNSYQRTHQPIKQKITTTSSASPPNSIKSRTTRTSRQSTDSPGTAPSSKYKSQTSSQATRSSRKPKYTASITSVSPSQGTPSPTQVQNPPDEKNRRPQPSNSLDLPRLTPKNHKSRQTINLPLEPKEITKTVLRLQTKKHLGRHRQG